MDQRLEFVRLHAAGGVSMAALCRRFGISRQTGHQLVRRFQAEGEAGLEPRSRRPRSSPRRTGPAAEAPVLALRAAHPAWGGRKIARALADAGHDPAPAPSTVTEILHRHGLINPASSQAHRPHQRFERAAPNELWQMDFKGHFALGLRACANETTATVRTELTRLFRLHGLPDAILCDNGSPWGTAGHTESRYTRLGVWLLRLGVALPHGRPGHLQTQGKAERFNRTLAVELLQHNRFEDLAACQAALDSWRSVYNQRRPHEALNGAVPASRYRPSARCFPEHVPEPEYHETDIVRRVSTHGYVTFKGRPRKMSQAFQGQNVALRPGTTDGVWTVWFSRFLVATFDLRNNATTE